jgi:hypothetical protein
MAATFSTAYKYAQVFLPFSVKATTLYPGGIDLTPHSSRILGGRRRRYHQTTPPGQAQCLLIFLVAYLTCESIGETVADNCGLYFMQ